jgi:hypothetical protein
MGTEPPSTLAERAIETIARSFDPVAWLPAYTTVCAARRDIARAKATRALDSLVTEFGLTVVRDTTSDLQRRQGPWGTSCPGPRSAQTL